MGNEIRDRVASAVGFIDRWLAFQRWYLELPSLAVGISVGDETIFARGYGYADVDARLPATETTRYRIASHSKVFTATALVRLAADGALRLDDRVADYLDWFSSATHPDLELVTVRQLLSHSSGLTRDGSTTHWHDDRFPSLDEVVEQIESGARVYGPVEHLKYSNIALTIAGQVIEAITGKSYDDYVRATILEPLDLSATTTNLPDDLDGHALGYPPRMPGLSRSPFDHVDAGVMDSATGFSSNVVDLLRWHQAHRFGTDQLLPDQWKREMQRVQFEGPNARWGLGFSLSRHGDMDFVSHAGGYPGFLTYSGLNQENELAIVVLTNSLDGPAWNYLDGIAKILARSIAGDFDAATTPDGTLIDLDDARRAAGHYNHRWRVTQFDVIGERAIFSVPKRLDPTETLDLLEPIDDHRWRFAPGIPLGSPGEEIRIEPGNPPTLHESAAPPTPRGGLPLDDPPW